MVIRVPESNSVKLIYITHFKNLPGLESLMHAQSRLKTVKNNSQTKTRLKLDLNKSEMKRKINLDK